MKKMIGVLTLCLVLLMVLLAGVAFAAGPFQTCAPQAGVQYYEMTGPVWVPSSVTAQTDGSLKLDVSPSAVGPNSDTLKACVDNILWGKLCSGTVPFSFTRPSNPNLPTDVKLVPGP